MNKSDVIKRIESICQEFDSRVEGVGLAIARLELAKVLAECESTQQNAQLTAEGVKTEDIYYSHRGRGPGIAREVYRNNGNVRMEYKADPSDFRWIQFEITEGALASKSCGWRKRAAQPGVQTAGDKKNDRP